MEPATVTDAIRAGLDAHQDGIFTSLVGRVEKYNAGTQTVDVKPMVKMPLFDSDDNRVDEELPVITNVPVMWPGGGGFFVAFPIAAGDFVLLVFNQWDIGQWRDTGVLSAADNVSRHSIGYPVAFPGIRPSKAALTSADAATATIGKDGADQQIVFTGSNVLVGRGATDFAALAQKVDTAISAIQAAFDGHTHIVATTGGPAAQTGTAAPVVSPVGPQETCAASITKVQ